LTHGNEKCKLPCMDAPRPVENRWQELQAADSPTGALAAARGLREALQLWEADLAKDAVEAGATWEALGAALGVSRQAAWERYSRRSGRHGRGERDFAERAERAVVRSVRQAQRAALADARSRVRDARRATGEQRRQLLDDARRKREEALDLLDRTTLLDDQDGPSMTKEAGTHGQSE
jgi:hypothetical protein